MASEVLLKWIKENEGRAVQAIEGEYRGKKGKLIDGFIGGASNAEFLRVQMLDGQFTVPAFDAKFLGEDGNPEGDTLDDVFKRWVAAQARASAGWLKIVIGARVYHRRADAYARVVADHTANQLEPRERAVDAFEQLEAEPRTHVMVRYEPPLGTGDMKRCVPLGELVFDVDVGEHRVDPHAKNLAVQLAEHLKIDSAVDDSEDDGKLPLEEQLIHILRKWLKRSMKELVDGNIGPARIEFALSNPHGDYDGVQCFDAKVKTSLSDEFTGPVPDFKDS